MQANITDVSSEVLAELRTFADKYTERETFRTRIFQQALHKIHRNTEIHIVTSKVPYPIEAKPCDLDLLGLFSNMNKGSLWE